MPKTDAERRAFLKTLRPKLVAIGQAVAAQTGPIDPQELAKNIAEARNERFDEEAATSATTDALRASEAVCAHLTRILALERSWGESIVSRAKGRLWATGSGKTFAEKIIAEGLVPGSTFAVTVNHYRKIASRPAVIVGAKNKS